MIRKRYRSRRIKRFTLEQCSRGGKATRDYDTAEDARQRALIDAKGEILRTWTKYSAKDGEIIETQCCKRRALAGRTNQVEVVADNCIVLTTGESKLRNRLSWLRD